MSNPALNDSVFKKAKADEMKAGWAAPQGMPAPSYPPPAAPYSNAPGIMPTPPQGYPQAGYPQPGYPQPGAPAQPGWPQQYPQQGYPPQGYQAPPAGFAPQPGYGPPPQAGYPQPGGYGPPPQAPYGPSPVSPWSAAPSGYKAMRLSGVVSATGVLLSLLLVGAVYGWHLVTVGTDGFGNVTVNTISPLLFGGIIVGFGLAITMRFRPKLAMFLGPLYAVAEGVALGGISHLYSAQYNGLVVQAIFATMAVFGAMLFLFAFKIIKVTEKMRSIVFAAMGGIFLIYMADIIVSFFGKGLPVIDSNSPIGIAFSVLVCIVAAFRLLINFDFVDRGIKMQAPRYMEWYSAFALLASMVWIYLELLRLLAKLRGGRR